MGFHFDHLTLEKPVAGALTDPLLQALDQGLVFLHRSGANSNVVVLGEDPGIEVRGDIGSDIHLGQIFVISHFFLGQANAFLESDRHVVVAGVHGFGYPAVGAIGTNNEVNF